MRDAAKEIVLLTLINSAAWLVRTDYGPRCCSSGMFVNVKCGLILLLVECTSPDKSQQSVNAPVPLTAVATNWL